jgi:citrate lyase subunit beta/citryl-CoA lyase
MSEGARVTEAGRTGDDVRSDLHVVFETRPSGGIELTVRSKVDAYYGESLRDQIAADLDRLGVRNALVTVDDRGALPFVIQARLEAAVRAAQAGEDRDARPDRTVPLVPPSPRDRMRRSRLYLPGNEPKYLVNAGLHGSDGIILDLEDSVHEAAKADARIVVRNALRCVDFGAAERMVRINPSPLGLEDIGAIAPEHPELLLIPKAEHPEQVREVDAAVMHVLGDSGRERPIWLMPILESAVGIEAAFDIATASPRVAALTIGLEDYTADLGVPKTPGGRESEWARARVVNAARAAGVQAIDSVFGDVGDLDGLSTWCAGSRALGFEGMGCIHPSQIDPIHAAFAPAPNEIVRAIRIVAAFRDAERRGLAVVSLGSKMIDPPVVERARTLVTRARALGLIDGDGEDDA